MKTPATVLGWPASQVAARLPILLGPLAGLVAAALAGIPPPGWVAVLIGVLAVGWAFMPESLLGTMCLALVLAWWGVADLVGLPAEALIAALGLLVAHVAAVVAAYGPSEMSVDGPTARLWVVRAALVLIAAPVVWLLAVVLRDQPEPPGVWIAAMVAIVVAAVVAAVAFGLPQETTGGA
jgi:hypothetical protein